MPADQQKARELFLHAVGKLPPEQWDGYVAEACGSDAELARQVGHLLEVHREAGSFLDRPAAAVGATGVFTPAAWDGPAPGERPGTVIGPYKLLQVIGEGGMGTVFMAEQTQPVRRKVALKVIKSGMDSGQVIARFEAERQALALMDHVNIARVLDAGATEAGLPYFVMELIHGVPITKYCDDNHLTMRERLDLFVGVCAAIQHAHQKGIIHRDVKPSNVLVTLYDGNPVAKVIDFGVAKATEQKLTERTLFTQYGAAVGTLEYMSPEQAEMSALGVDTRSDIFSLGVLLYELLTGTTPLGNKRVREAAYGEVLRMIKEEEPPRPSTRLSDSGEALASISAQRRTEPAKLAKLVRGELDWIVMKCLEKDRNRRYETASAFAADVRRYLNDEPVQACPPSAMYRLRKLVRRHKGPVLAASLLVLALVVGIIGTTWGMFRASEARADAEKETEQKETALTAARLSEREAQDQLFLSLLSQARAGRFSRQMGQRLDSLDALAKAAGIRPDERLRDEAIAAMALPDVRRHGPSWNALPPGSKTIAFDGLYQVYARADNQGVISVRTIPDDREVRRIVSDPTTHALWLSPDGRFLGSAAAGYKLRVWRVADGQPVLGDELSPVWCVAFSPDSRQLAVGREGWALRFDLTTGQELNRWRLPAEAWTMEFHPDNHQLAVGYLNAKVASVYDATDGTLITALSVGPSIEHVVAWHPDGQRLAVAGSNPAIQIWDVAARRKLATLEGHVQRVTGLSFHPDGELLASASHDGVVRLWHPSSGQPLMQLPLAGSEFRDVKFSSDGRWLGVERHGEQAQMLEVASSREYRTLVSDLGAGQGGFHNGDISPDGRLLAVGMADGTRLWNLHSRRQLAMLPGDARNVFFDRIGPRWDLLTDGANGLLRWPAQSDGPASPRLRLGPPRQLSPLYRADFARTPEARTLAAVYGYGGETPIQILDLVRDVMGQKLGVHEKGDGPHAVSADGRWLASCGWHSNLVRVWNARTGQMEREWNLGQRARVFFTPDSRALVISKDDEFSFWDVDTWQPIRRLRRDVAGYPGYVAFSPAGALMALEMAPAVIHLKEVATGRTVAKLEDPHGDRTRWLGFTPDGTQLVTTANYAHAIHIWNLRAIRECLKAIRLDWDWDEFPPAAPSSKAAELRLVEVRLGDLAKPALSGEQKARQEIERSRRAVEASPDSAAACNCLAWVYLTAPEALRDVKAALILAEKAVRLGPGNADYRNTLGVAYYRAGLYREAVKALRPNLDSQGDAGLACDLYFLAMSHHQLGETARAQDYYTWAVRWPLTNRSLSAGQLEELALFRAEAAQLLRIDKKKD